MGSRRPPTSRANATAQAGISAQGHKKILIASAVAAMAPLVQSAAIEEPISACGIEAEKSGALACAPKQPAQHHFDHDADAPTYRATVGITVTPGYPALPQRRSVRA